MSELEASVWCLAADVTAGSRLVWYLPYVFVDAGQAVASGREVYGYPKQIGSSKTTIPTSGERGHDDGLGASDRPLREGREGEPAPMLSADHQPAGGPAGAGGFPDLFELFATRLDIRDKHRSVPRLGPRERSRRPALRVPRRARASSVPAWAGRRVLDTLLGRGRIEGADDLIGEMMESPTLVFLKQFRDVSCPTKACYQAIVEAPLAIHLSTASLQGAR